MFSCHTRVHTVSHVNRNINQLARDSLISVHVILTGDGGLCMYCCHCKIASRKSKVVQSNPLFLASYLQNIYSRVWLGFTIHNTLYYTNLDCRKVFIRTFMMKSQVTWDRLRMVSCHVTKIKWCVRFVALCSLNLCINQ